MSWKGCFFLENRKIRATLQGPGSPQLSTLHGSPCLYLRKANSEEKRYGDDLFTWHGEGRPSGLASVAKGRLRGVRLQPATGLGEKQGGIREEKPFWLKDNVGT